MLNTHIFLDTVIDGFAYICDKYWFRLRYSALSQKSKQKYCLHCNFYTQCHSLSYSSVIGSLLHNLFHWQLWVVSSLLLPKQIFKKIKFWRWFKVFGSIWELWTHNMCLKELSFQVKQAILEIHLKKCSTGELCSVLQYCNGPFFYHCVNLSIWQSENNK